MFGFPIIDRPANFEFKKNILKSITLQVMFDRIDIISKKETIVKILSGQFPTNRDLSTNVFEFKNVNNVPQVISKPSSITGLTFESTPQKVLQINQDSISYTYDGLVYKNIETFWAEIKSNFFSTLKELGINECTRIGLRKINALKLDFKGDNSNAQEMSIILNEALMASINAIPSSKYLNSTLSNMSFKNGDNTLVLTFGLLPSEIGAQNLLLDIDNILLGKIELKNLETKLIELNNETFNIFNWALHKNELLKLSGK